ncbi:MFS transporter [Peribacillus frigoritolerans]|uniref:MFS transporter n=1 Tax=Peribacillus frigoritolerans TaxID=450367 RepID=UPI0039A354E1
MKAFRPLLGIVVVFYLTNRPSNAKWLSKEESDWLEGELNAERKVSSKINKVTKLDMLKDSKIWKLALFFARYTSIYGLSFWMPTIIKSLSENATTNLEIGWLAMIPSLVGIHAVMFVGWNSDRTNEHKTHLLVCLMIAVVGFIGCGFSNSVFMMVLMLTITSFGLYGFSGCFFAYMTFFFTESTAPVGIAIVNSFAALGGFVGPMILITVAFTQGMFILSGLLMMGVITLLSLKLTDASDENKVKKLKSILIDYKGSKCMED